MFLGVRNRQALRCRGIFAGKMCACDHYGLGRGNIGLVNILDAQRQIGTVVAVKNQRKSFFIPYAEHNQCGEAVLINFYAAHIHALAGALLGDEAPHMFIADAGDQAGFEAKPRGANGNIGRTPANSLGKAGHIFQLATHLRAIKVNAGTANGNDIKNGCAHNRWSPRCRSVAFTRSGLCSIQAFGSSGASPAPITFWSKSILAPVIRPDSSLAR